MDSLWFKKFLGVVRAPFLSLSFTTVFFAWSLAFYQTGFPSFIDGILVLAAVLFAHMGVNALNEYQDYVSGLDDSTSRTLFSGGSGTLVEYPEFLNTTRWTARTCISISFVIGVWFVLNVGIELLPVGVFGLWLVVNYSTRIHQNPWLCLLAPGVGIGLLATLGIVYILSGYLSWAVVVLAISFALLIGNVLLLNQFPDIAPDKSVDRKHLWITFGEAFTLAVFRVQLLVAFGIVIFAVFLGAVPWLCISVLFVLVFIYPIFKNTLSVVNLEKELLSTLGKNVMLCHLFPLSLAISLIICRLIG